MTEKIQLAIVMMFVAILMAIIIFFIFMPTFEVEPIPEPQKNIQQRTEMNEGQRAIREIFEKAEEAEKENQRKREEALSLVIANYTEEIRKNPNRARITKKILEKTATTNRDKDTIQIS